MKSSFLRALLILSLLAIPLVLSEHLFADDPPKKTRPNIYDESADGNKQIADALAVAHKDGKRVLLKFGANWCIWCHRLHELFDADTHIAAELKSDYVVVLVDVNKEHNKDVDLKYGHPMRFGLPVLVVLDAEGKQLTTKDSGELEQGDHHSPEKVLAFLKEWAPKR
ncbi:MAG: thiol:disulfide interchange protein precursor [Pedosphaera sp.]|nr:thiol:disulfide interchange protein precursor [Pedosphaera sp.]